MKQSRHDAGRRVDPRKVAGLVEIALGTGERQVGKLIVPAVLPGDDMFDLKSDQRGTRLRALAVFAGIASP